MLGASGRSSRHWHYLRPVAPGIYTDDSAESVRAASCETRGREEVSTAGTEYGSDTSWRETLLKEAGHCESSTDKTWNNSPSQANSTGSDDEGAISMCIDDNNVDSSEESALADQGSPTRLDDLHERIFDDLPATVID